MRKIDNDIAIAYNVLQLLKLTLTLMSNLPNYWYCEFGTFNTIAHVKGSPLWFFGQKNHDVPQQKVHIFDSASNSEAKTPNEITIIAQR